MEKSIEEQRKILRDELRIDLEDYKLLHTRQKLYNCMDDKFEDGDLFLGWYSGEDFCGDDGKPFDDLAIVYKNYLSRCIHEKLSKLKNIDENINNPNKIFVSFSYGEAESKWVSDNNCQAKQYWSNDFTESSIINLIEDKIKK